MRQIYHKVWMYSTCVVKFNSDTPGLNDIVTYFRRMDVKILSRKQGRLMMYAVDIDFKQYEAFVHWANSQLYQHIQMPKEMLQLV